MRWTIALLFIAGCETASPGEPPPTSTTREAEDAGQVQQVHRASDALQRCAESKGELASITDAVARLNALEQADGPCFVATLPRPLAVVATFAVTSAQPAGGVSSPRLFFLLPKLAISAVPEGKGSKLLEFGEWVTPTRTIKGEVALPITSPLEPDAAFQRVLEGENRTMCAACHRDEERHPSIPNAFVSAAFKPALGTFVTFAELEALHDTCTSEDDASERCAMLHAVFDFGEVTPGAFAPEVEVFF